MHTAQSLPLYHNYLFAYALHRTRDRELASDLVQETYLAALESVVSFEQRSSLRTWLTAILKNKTCDAYRKKAMEKQKVGVWKEEPREEMFPANYELLPLIGRAANKLPPLWQQVFTMKNIEEKFADEICRSLNLTPANYWVISHRARRSLRQNLQGFV